MEEQKEIREDDHEKVSSGHEWPMYSWIYQTWGYLREIGPVNIDYGRRKGSWSSSTIYEIIDS